MRKLIILLISIICFSVSCYASDDTDSARGFIDKFLKAEYMGDAGFRVLDAIYSPGRKLWVERNYSPMSGEIPQWDEDQICVVDSYEIKEIKIENQKAIIDVEFQEFARTDGEKGCVYRPLIKTGKKIVEKYNLEYKDERWWIYDPPVPRVSRKALIDHNNNRIKGMSEWVFKKGSDMQKEYYNNSINANKLLEEK